MGPYDHFGNPIILVEEDEHLWMWCQGTLVIEIQCWVSWKVDDWYKEYQPGAGYRHTVLAENEEEGQVIAERLRNRHHVQCQAQWCEVIAALKEDRKAKVV